MINVEKLPDGYAFCMATEVEHDATIQITINEKEEYRFELCLEHLKELRNKITTIINDR